MVDRVARAAGRPVPEQQGVAIVHGDYRLDNTVLDDGGEVLAILDWEICTLGDPLADLGLLLVYWAEPDDGDQALLGVAPTALPGFARAFGVDEPLCGTSGRDVWRSPTTGRSGSGSWPASSRGSTPATRAAPPPATERAPTSSRPTSGRLGQRALAEVESL